MSSLDLLEVFGEQSENDMDFLFTKVTVIQKETGGYIRLPSYKLNKYDFRMGDKLLLPFMMDGGVATLDFVVVHIRKLNNTRDFKQKIYFAGNSYLQRVYPRQIYRTLREYESRIPDDILDILDPIRHEYDGNNTEFGNYEGKLNIPSQANVCKKISDKLIHKGFDDILFTGLSKTKDKAMGFKWYCDTRSSDYYSGISGVNKDGRSQIAHSIETYRNEVGILPIISIVVTGCGNDR